jgi:hypothetical protein
MVTFLGKGHWTSCQTFLLCAPPEFGFGLSPAPRVTAHTLGHRSSESLLPPSIQASFQSVELGQPSVLSLLLPPQVTAGFTAFHPSTLFQSHWSPLCMWPLVTYPKPRPLYLCVVSVMGASGNPCARGRVRFAANWTKLTVVVSRARVKFNIRASCLTQGRCRVH